MKLAVIPARGGSKGLKDKNIARLCGKPLIRYTIEAALQSKLFDKIVVTTDSKEIASYTKGVEHIIRSPELAGDDVPLSPVIYDTLVRIEKDSGFIFHDICTLQPTSPFRNAGHIKESYDYYVSRRAESLLSVKEELHSIWKYDRTGAIPIVNPNVNRQFATPFYVGNGGII